MKTKEQILSEHTDYDVEELLERKSSPILQPYDCLRAMEEYAQQFIPVSIDLSCILEMNMTPEEILSEWRKTGVVFLSSDEINEYEQLPVYVDGVLND